jgi:hypothetical protein
MEELTPAWLVRLIGNLDAYAEQQDDGSWEPRRGRVDWHAVLDAHLAGDLTAGTYVLRGANARTLVFDVDENDRVQVDALGKALSALGVPPKYVGVEFSGRKGYHLWVVTSHLVPAKVLRRLGAAVLAESGVRCEVFPKQDEARDLGNLVKLPGGLHRVSGKRSRMLKGMEVLPVAVLKEVLTGIPELPMQGQGIRPQPFRCMELAQEGPPPGSRNNALFQLAVMLRRGGASDENTAMAVQRSNEKSSEPLDSWEVERLLESSKQSGPICHQLGADLSCGEACVLRRSPGLYTRSGALSAAAEGEYVVMRAGERRGKLIDLHHPDLRQGSGALWKEQDG